MKNKILVIVTSVVLLFTIQSAFAQDSLETIMVENVDESKEVKIGTNFDKEDVRLVSALICSIDYNIDWNKRSFKNYLRSDDKTSDGINGHFVFEKWLKFQKKKLGEYISNNKKKKLRKPIPCSSIDLLKYAAFEISGHVWISQNYEQFESFERNVSIEELSFCRDSPLMLFLELYEIRRMSYDPHTDEAGNTSEIQPYYILESTSSLDDICWDTLKDFED